MGLTFIMPLRNSTKVPLKVSMSDDDIVNERFLSSPFDWDVQVSEVAKYEVDETLVAILAQEFNERLGCELFPKFVRG